MNDGDPSPPPRRPVPPPRLTVRSVVSQEDRIVRVSGVVWRSLWTCSPLLVEAEDVIQFMGMSWEPEETSSSY